MRATPGSTPIVGKAICFGTRAICICSAYCSSCSRSLARTRSTLDATDRETEGPIWWALLTLVVGYGIGPIAMGVFLVCYLLVHLLEEWWVGDRGDATVQA